MGSYEKIIDQEKNNEEFEVNIDELAKYIPYSKHAKTLASSVKRKLSTLAPDPLNYGTVCIYRIPEKYRTKKKEAYSPRLMAIGPLQREDRHLQAMEEYKFKYLNNFLHSFRVPVELLAEYVKSKEKLVRECYEDDYICKSSELLEMILLDGVFIVQLFLKNHFPEMRETGDKIFENGWVKNDILHDMLLLENQLPMRVTRTLYDGFVHGKLSKFLDDSSVDPPSFDELAHEYLKNVGNTGKLELNPNHPCPRHLVEFLAILHWPSVPREEPPEEAKFEYTRSAAELRQAGVRFKRGEGKCLFEVHFDIDKGELRLPELTINDHTETFFRNVIAFEECGHQSKYITSYVILMDSLINTAKDVDLLIKNKIIIDPLDDSEKVAELFNNLYKEIVHEPGDFYFLKTCHELNQYSRNYWHEWKATIFRLWVILKSDYCTDLWTTCSVFAAVLLLILTLIQTVCSILQVL